MGGDPNLKRLCREDYRLSLFNQGQPGLFSQPKTLGFFVPRQIQWAPAPDGRRFLVAVPKSSGPEPYTVVLNWQASLKK